MRQLQLVLTPEQKDYLRKVGRDFLRPNELTPDQLHDICKFRMECFEDMPKEIQEWLSNESALGLSPEICQKVTQEAKVYGTQMVLSRLKMREKALLEGVHQQAITPPKAAQKEVKQIADKYLHASRNTISSSARQDDRAAESSKKNTLT